MASMTRIPSMLSKEVKCYGSTMVSKTISADSTSATSATRTVWINRFGIQIEESAFKPHGTLTDDKVRSIIMGWIKEKIPDADWSEVFDE